MRIPAWHVERSQALAKVGIPGEIKREDVVARKPAIELKPIPCRQRRDHRQDQQRNSVSSRHCIAHELETPVMRERSLRGVEWHRACPPSPLRGMAHPRTRNARTMQHIVNVREGSYVRWLPRQILVIRFFE